jgi:hypothetical protein
MSKIRNKNIGAGATGGATPATGFGGSSTQKAMGTALPAPPPGVVAPTGAPNAAPAGRPPSPFAKSKQTSGQQASGSVFGENAPESLMSGPSPMPAPPPVVSHSAGYGGNFGVGGEGAAPPPVVAQPAPVVPAETPAAGAPAGQTPGVHTTPEQGGDQPPAVFDGSFSGPHMEELPGQNPYPPGTRDFKLWEAKKNEIKDRNMANGFSLEDMGKKNIHEQGQSSFSALQALDAYGPSWREGDVYDLSNGTVGLHGNRGEGGAGPTHDYGSAAMDPSQVEAIHQWQSWTGSPEGKGWARAYGGSPYRGWLVKQSIEKEVAHGNLDHAPGGGYTDYGPGGVLRAYYDQFGRPTAPPAGVPLHVAMDAAGHPMFGAPMPTDGGGHTPSTPAVPGAAGTPATPSPMPAAPPVGNVPAPDIRPGTVPTLPGGNVTASSVAGPAAAAAPAASPMPAAPPAAATNAPATPTTPPPALGAPTVGAPTNQVQNGVAQAPVLGAGATPAVGTSPAAAPVGATPGSGPAPVASASAMPAAPPAAPGAPGAPAAPAAVQQPPTIEKVTPEHLDALPPGGTIQTPAAVFTRDRLSGRITATLTPLGQQRLAAAEQQATKRFGPRPLTNDPRAPQPEIQAGRWNYNPLGSGFTR